MRHVIIYFGLPDIAMVFGLSMRSRIGRFVRAVESHSEIHLTGQGETQMEPWPLFEVGNSTLQVKHVTLMPDVLCPKTPAFKNESGLTLPLSD
jgi:hypothetical protein